MVLYSRCGMCGFPVVSTLDSRARIHALQQEFTRLLLQFRTRTLTTRIQHESERAVHIHLETQHKFSVHWHSCRFLLPCQSPAQQSGLRDYCNGCCSCLFLALTGFNRVSLGKCHTSAHWFNRRQSADGGERPKVGFRQLEVGDRCRGFHDRLSNCSTTTYYGRSTLPRGVLSTNSVPQRMLTPRNILYVPI